MATMDASNRLKKILEETPARLSAISNEKAFQPRAPGKWSAKEELGHLVDSAANNHQRFVRMQSADKLQLLKYQQDEWVKIQHYDALPFIEIIQLWKTYNRHLLHVIKTVNPTTLTYTATIGDYGSKTLQFLIDDYVDHLKHHLGTIFGEPFPYGGSA